MNIVCQTFESDCQPIFPVWQRCKASREKQNNALFLVGGKSCKQLHFLAVRLVDKRRHSKKETHSMFKRNGARNITSGIFRQEGTELASQAMFCDLVKGEAVLLPSRSQVSFF